MKPVPHGEPYAGKLHVRFDEGAGVPHGASRSTLHPSRSPSYECPLCDLDCDEYPIWNRNVKDLKIERLSKAW